VKGEGKGEREGPGVNNMRGGVEGVELQKEVWQQS